MIMEKINYSWKQLAKDVQTLTVKLTENPELLFKDIYGLPTGGLVLAAFLSQTLNLPVKQDEITDDTLVVTESIKESELPKDVNYKIAAIFYDPDLGNNPQTSLCGYVRLKKKEVRFPWEL